MRHFQTYFFACISEHCESFGTTKVNHFLSDGGWGRGLHVTIKDSAHPNTHGRKGGCLAGVGVLPGLCRDAGEGVGSVLQGVVFLVGPPLLDVADLVPDTCKPIQCVNNLGKVLCQQKHFNESTAKKNILFPQIWKPFQCVNNSGKVSYRQLRKKITSHIPGNHFSEPTVWKKNLF